VVAAAVQVPRRQGRQGQGPAGVHGRPRAAHRRGLVAGQAGAVHRGAAALRRPRGAAHAPGPGRAAGLVARRPPPPRHGAGSAGEGEGEVRGRRARANKDFNEKGPGRGVGLYNTAAALDQSWELLNPEAAVKRGCSLAVREGPSVAYHLNTRLSVPSRHDEQVLEVTRIDLPPDYSY